jgi:hypothetical protein
VSLPSDAGFFNFLNGLGVQHGPADAPALFLRIPSPVKDIPMVTPGFEPPTTSGWPSIPGDSDDDGEIPSFLRRCTQSNPVELLCQTNWVSPTRPILQLSMSGARMPQRPW